VDFFAPQAQAEAIAALLLDGEQRRRLANGARAGAQAYGANQGLRAWTALLATGLSVDTD